MKFKKGDKVWDGDGHEAVIIKPTRKFGFNKNQLYLVKYADGEKFELFEGSLRKRKMNKKQEYEWRRKFMDKLDRSILTRDGSLNEIGSKSYEHEKFAFDICHFAKKYLIREWISSNLCGQPNPNTEFLFRLPDDSKIKSKAEVYTEVRSSDRKFRADVLLLYPKENKAFIIEIAKNESDESLNRKRKFWEKESFIFIEVRL